MITNFQTFEQINPDDVFDREGKFLCETSHHDTMYFYFLWNIRDIDNTTKSCDYIKFQYNYGGSFRSVSIDTIHKGENLQFNKGEEILLTPSEFYESYTKIFVNLWEKANKVITDTPNMVSFRKQKFNKLIDTLESVEEFKIKIETDKFNL